MVFFLFASVCSFSVVGVPDKLTVQRLSFRLILIRGVLCSTHACCFVRWRNASCEQAARRSSISLLRSCKDKMDSLQCSTRRQPHRPDGYYNAFLFCSHMLSPFIQVSRTSRRGSRPWWLAFLRIRALFIRVSSSTEPLPERLVLDKFSDVPLVSDSHLRMSLDRWSARSTSAKQAEHRSRKPSSK